MTQQEILDYNKRCAQFLNWEEGQQGSWFKTDDSAKYVVYSEHNNYPHKGLPFHRDWNWIIEVVEAIDKIQHTQLDILGKYCRISSKGIDFKGSSKEDKKEAVIQAINQFLIYYNNENNNNKQSR